MFLLGITDCSWIVGRGRIQIRTFAENFAMVFEFWSPEEYERHWNDAIQRMVDGAQVGALTTSLTNPDMTNFLFWWPMFRDRDLIVFQNSMLFVSELEDPFRLDDYYAFVPPKGTRETCDARGASASKGRMSLALDGGPDGLDLVRRLVHAAPDALAPGGLLALEHGFDQATAVADIIAARGAFSAPRLRKDLGKQPRITFARRL
jgi:hypothetical protein